LSAALSPAMPEPMTSTSTTGASTSPPVGAAAPAGCRASPRAVMSGPHPAGLAGGRRGAGLGGEHPLQRQARRLGDVACDGDAVDDLALQQRLERPGEVAGVDA